MTRPTVAMIWRNWPMTDSALEMPKLSGSCGLHVAAAAKDLGHLVLGPIHFARLDQHADEVVLGLGIGLLERVIGDEDGLVVLVVAQERLEFRERADDFQGVPVHQNGLADGIFVREESLAHAVADHGHVAAVEVVRFGEETALGQRGVDEPQVVRGHADEKGVEHVLALVPGGDGGQAEVPHFAKELHGNRFGGRRLLLDGHGVFVAQGLAQPLFARHRVGRAELQLVNPQRAGSELLGHVHQLLVQAGDDGGHRDHRGGADEHAEDGEERAEFVRAQRVERQQQILANVLSVGLRHGKLSSPV